MQPGVYTWRTCTLRVLSAPFSRGAALKQVAIVLESTLGASPTAFKPNATHVMLVAVMLAVLITGERLRAAILRKR